MSLLQKEISSAIQDTNQRVVFANSQHKQKLCHFSSEKVVDTAIEAYLCELEDPTKATGQYTSAFGSEFSYSYDHCNIEEKNANTMRGRWC